MAKVNDYQPAFRALGLHVKHIDREGVLRFRKADRREEFALEIRGDDQDTVALRASDVADRYYARKFAAPGVA